jgi:hypothetical protein
MTTKELIFSMLVENTGKALCDSGDAYGRNWQRNQGKTIEDFEREPEERIVWTGNYLERSVSVFHYLSQLETDWVCDYFNELPCLDWECECDDVYGVSETQWNWLNSKCEVKVINSFNSYNGDSDLSQIIQGTWLEINDEQYLLLQIHGGCDARGGYTDAKLFKPREEYYIHEYLREYMDSRDLTDDIEQDCAYVYDQEGNVMDNKELLELLNKS